MHFESESYGKYVIKSGPLKGQWCARAFRRQATIAEALAATREAAIAGLKSDLDRIDDLEVSDLDEEGAPEAKVYERALLIILPQVAPSYFAMLRAHLTAPDYLISATGLSKAAGYAGYEGANLHYGKLGQQIAQEIGFVPPRRANGTEIWTCAIARDPSHDPEFPNNSALDAVMRAIDTGHFEWQMRPQVVQALVTLGFIIRPAASLEVPKA